MKFKLFRVSFLFIFAGLFLLGCNQEPDPTSDLPPTISTISNDVITNNTPVDAPSVEPPVVTDKPADPVNEEVVEEPVEVVETPTEASPPDTAVPAIGSTVQHQVQVGEWLVQLARCYGADYLAVRQANPQIYWADYIMPGTIVTIPNVGSVGDVQGAPCVAEYVVEVGDTWLGLAERFGTTAVILQRVNPGLLWAGNKIIVPAHTIVTETVAPVSDPEQPEVVTLPDATRITFTDGATSATVTGSVAAGQLTHYVFTANEGQQLAIEFTPSDAGVTYLVTPPGLGNVLPEDNVLPTTGDYYIAITGGSADATFTLAVSIITP